MKEVISDNLVNSTIYMYAGVMLHIEYQVQQESKRCFILLRSQKQVMYNSPLCQQQSAKTSTIGS